MAGVPMAHSKALVVDDYASLFVDVIPIWAPPRYGSPQMFNQNRHLIRSFIPINNGETTMYCLGSKIGADGKTFPFVNQHFKNTQAHLLDTDNAITPNKINYKAQKSYCVTIVCKVTIKLPL